MRSLKHANLPTILTRAEGRKFFTARWAMPSTTRRPADGGVWPKIRSFFPGTNLVNSAFQAQLFKGGFCENSGRLRHRFSVPLRGSHGAYAHHAPIARRRRS